MKILKFTDKQGEFRIPPIFLKRRRYKKRPIFSNISATCEYTHAYRRVEPCVFVFILQIKCVFDEKPKLQETLAPSKPKIFILGDLRSNRCDSPALGDS